MCWRNRAATLIFAGALLAASLLPNGALARTVADSGLDLGATKTAAPATPAPDGPPMDRRIAITIDDLPWQTSDNNPWYAQGAGAALMARQHAKLMAAIASEKAPVVGFVNEGKLVVDDKIEGTRLHMLRDWLDAGADLGNHTYSHADLHAVGLDAYEGDILRGDVVLRGLLEEKGKVPVWFRHPYLRAGRSAEEKAALQAFLTEHGYRIAPVTHDNSEWVWAAAYRNVLKAGGDEATLAKLRHDYVPYMIERLAYYERQSVALVGYNIPHVLLIHANELAADTYPALLAAMRTRGYTFVSLDEAVSDPAYRRPDGYVGKYGPSWIHRWAIAEKKPREFFAGESVMPAWVMTLAGVDSE